MLFKMETAKEFERVCQDLEKVVVNNKFGVMAIHSLNETSWKRKPRRCKIKPWYFVPTSERLIVKVWKDWKTDLLFANVYEGEKSLRPKRVGEAFAALRLPSVNSKLLPTLAV